MGEWKHDSQLDGAIAVAKAGAQYADGVVNEATVWNCPAGDYATCTGWYYELSSTSGFIYVQTISGLYLLLDLKNPLWELTEGKAVSNYSATNAQKQINKIIDNNQTILQNNLVCARFADKLTSEQRTMLYDLQTRLNRRNELLLNNELCVVDVVEAPEGYAELQSYLTGFMNEGRVGSVTVAIVVAAIVVASLSTAAYFAYKYYADESDEDVRYSKELTAILTSKLTEEEYEMLREETKGIVTKAKLKTKLSSISSKTLLLAAGVLAAIVLAKKL